MLLSLWPFSSGYFLRNWDVLGGGHFIEMATGINIALIGWEAFRNRVRSADRQLEGKINSVAASVSDSLDSKHYRWLIDQLLLPILRIRTFGWGVVYGLAIMTSILGVALLYCAQSSPYAVLLLLPAVIQLVVSWTTLAIMMVWMRLMRKGMLIFGGRIPSRQTATAEVKEFVREARHGLSEQRHD